MSHLRFPATSMNFNAMFGIRPITSYKYRDDKNSSFAQISLSAEDPENLNALKQVLRKFLIIV